MAMIGRCERIPLVFNQYYFKKSVLQTESLTNHKYDEITDQDKKLFCKFCKSGITDLDAAIFVNGAQTHTFSNPAGFIYTIHCFDSAPGCDVVGEGSYEHTWFNGYEWKIAICHSCKQQLGWLFSNDDYFYGLISDHLINAI